MSSETRLLYFADPMCSWCWGFSPVLDSLAQAYPELPLTAVMGGLRAGEQRPVTADVRDTVLHHWQQVAEASGQPFRFDGALPDGFVYDTEPACRAVVSVRRLDPAQERAALAAVQRAFYAEGRDVTDTGTLVAIAGELGLDEPAFRDVFQAAETRTATVADFDTSRESGVTGFPTLLLDRGERRRIVSIGWCPWDTLRERLERTLQRDA